MQVVAVNKMLADMSKKAQDSFAGMSKGLSLKPLRDMEVSLVQTNKAVADTAAGVHGAITKVTSVTRVYTDALEDTLTTYRGFNNTGAQVQQVVRGVGEAMEVLKTSVTTKDAGAALVKETEQAYRRLLKSQTEYLSALKSGDEVRKSYWQSEIDSSHQTLQANKQAVESTSLTAYEKQKIIRFTNDAEQAERKHSHAVKQTSDSMNAQRKASEQAEQNVRRMVDQVERWLATMLVMRGLTSLWREMIDYASSYYDAMNEIRIITGDSVEAAERMGASYRRMAQDMSVSSTEIAKAAVEFWRQGLNPEEVNERLKYTTAYAKISALEFDRAAELMTAATNGMGVSAERIADVWSYLGDASAAGADE